MIVKMLDNEITASQQRFTAAITRASFDAQPCTSASPWRSLDLRIHWRRDLSTPPGIPMNIRRSYASLLLRYAFDRLRRNK
jgi:hypothetical protein